MLQNGLCGLKNSPFQDIGPNTTKIWKNVAVNAELVLSNGKKPAITSDKRKRSISFLMMRMKPDTNPQILP
jgi:hypothetical protein